MMFALRALTNIQRIQPQLPLIKSVREAGKKSAEQLKNDVHAVALTGDHWISVSYKNPLAVTAHYRQ